MYFQEDSENSTPGAIVRYKSIQLATGHTIVHTFDPSFSPHVLRESA